MNSQQYCFREKVRHGDSTRGRANKDRGFREVPSLDEEPHITNESGGISSKPSGQHRTHYTCIKLNGLSMLYTCIYIPICMHIFIYVFIYMHTHNNHSFYSQFLFNKVLMGAKESRT